MRQFDKIVKGVLTEGAWDDPRIAAIMNKVGSDNRKREQKSPKPSKAQVEVLAQLNRRFLRDKGLRRMTSDATFWKKEGSNRSTKMTGKEAQALVDAGYATLDGDPYEGGTTLHMIPLTPTKSKDSTKGLPCMSCGARFNGWTCPHCGQRHT